MTYKSKNAQVMLKDLCMKSGEFFEKKNNSGACSSFNIDLRKVHVTIKIFQHDSLLFNKCNHGIFYVKLNASLGIFGFEIEENAKKCDFEAFQPPLLNILALKT